MKKVISVLLILSLALTIFGAAAAATGSPAETGDGEKVIYFDAASAGWNDGATVMVYCYCPENGDIQIDWGSRKKGAMKDEGNGILSYDFDAKHIALDPDKQYCLIFNHDGLGQTHDLLFDATCFGDTVVVNPEKKIENPADSERRSLEARWKSGKLGPTLCITSIGNVVGEVIPAFTTGYKMFVAFLTNTLDNARTFSGKDDKPLLDDTAQALGLSQEDIQKAITESGVEVDWEPTPVTKYLLGDLNGNGKVNNADYQLLARYVLGWAGAKEKIKNFKAADMNRNGKVNNADYQILARYVLGWPGYNEYVFEVEELNGIADA